MSDLSTISFAKPKYADETIILTGTKAYDLAIKYQTTIEPRLPKKTIAELADDLQTVGVVVPAAKQARAQTSVSVAAQRTLLMKGLKLFRDIRRTVSKNSTDRDVRKAYGGSQKVNSKVAKDVLAVLNLIQDRAAKKPAEPATLGITQKDLDAVTQAIADITEAFNSREKQRAAAPLTTRTRNQTLNRILLASGRIAAAGQLEFTTEPAIAKEFAAAAPPPLPKKKSAAKKATAKPKTKAAPAAPAPAPAASANDAPANDAPAPTPAASTPPAAPASTPETPAAPATPVAA